MGRFKLVIILGPTAIGKTALSVRLASRLGCDVISADSRQVYREMNIGTAKPTPEEQKGVRHHMIGHIGISDYYSAGLYEDEVIKLIRELSRNQPAAVMAGGSGLYIQAVCKGIDEMPGPDFPIRQKLLSTLEKNGLETLAAELVSLDPETGKRIDLKNPKRVIRALEVIYQISGKYSAVRKGHVKLREFDYLKIGLECNRELLYNTINSRAECMLEMGLLKEVEQLFPFRHLTALQTVGYREFFGFMEGAYDLEEAIRLFKRNGRRYAKKQLTWFKRDPEIQWFDTGSIQKIWPVVDGFINQP